MFTGWLALILKGIPGLVEAVGNVIVKRAETQTVREGNENNSGAALALNWLTSVNETNKIKAEHQTERQIMAGLLLFAVPTGIHWWFVLLDSIPFYFPYVMDAGHKVGSWKVAAPPGLWAQTYHMIIQSYFIATPAIAGAALLAKAFRR